MLLWNSRMTDEVEGNSNSVITEGVGRVRRMKSSFTMASCQQTTLATDEVKKQ